MGEVNIPLTVVARLYEQNNYKRASVRTGPGEPLVRLADAERAVEVWKWQFEGRTEAMEDYKRICGETMQELKTVAAERDTLRAEVERLREYKALANEARPLVADGHAKLAAAQAEFARLRAVEKAAIASLEMVRELDPELMDCPDLQELAEACGRKW